MHQIEWRKKITVERIIEPHIIVDFALLTGDDASHHLNADSAKSIGYRDIVSQGLLLLGLTGRASSQYLIETGQRGVTYGYEKIRIPAAAYGGDSLTITYDPQSINERNVISSLLTITNQSDQVVLVATHLLKIFTD